MSKNVKFYVWYLSKILSFVFLFFLVSVFVVILLGYKAIIYEPNPLIASVELGMVFFLIFSTYQDFVKGLVKHKKRDKYE